MAKRSFLCLTDLHFADQNTNFLDDSKDLGRSYGGSYRTNALSHVKAIIEHGFKAGDLDFIAVVGDITTHGRKEGFDAFTKELLPLLQPLVPDDALCIVPGNHDVKWSLDPNEKGYYDEKFALFVDMVDIAQATTCLFPKGEVREDIGSKTTFNIPRHGPLYVNDEKQILVLNINSAIRCGELHKDMRKAFVDWYGSDFPLLSPSDKTPDPKAALISKYFLRDIAQFTSEQQERLQAILIREKNRIGLNWGEYLKVALVHHHVVHYPGQVTEHKGYEFMLDSSTLLALLTGFDFDLILTGHKHHPYEMKHLFGGKEILIVGGPTVGGYESPGNFRGIRHFEFDNDGSRRLLKIKNIEEALSKGDIKKALDESPQYPLFIDLPSHSAFNRGLQKYGYSYREIVATTNITSAGDAFRTVKYEDLILKKSTPRSNEHIVIIPWTSGYVDVKRFEAGPSSLHINVSDLTPPSPMPKTAKIKLEFRHSLPVESEPISYWCKWVALNSFAHDRAQFRKLHPKDESKVKVEFTHFRISDPVETLRILIRSPEHCKFLNPDIRVAIPNPKVEDSRLWELDNEAAQLLKDRHALKVMDGLDTVELVVTSPSPDLSYGIEWEVPDPIKKPDLNIPSAIRRISSADGLSSKNLSKVLEGVRKVLLRDWGGQIDISVMVFGLKGHAGMLKSVAAARITRGQDGECDVTADIDIALQIPYGAGVAGRAFRADAVQFHVAPDPLADGATRQDDFFVSFDGALDHRRLNCFPLHIPVTLSAFRNEREPYTTSEPYGILNIGSEDEECPLSRDQIANERQLNSVIKTTQHEINRAIWIQLFNFVDPDVEKRHRNVGKASRKRPG
jgi:hypothetical protein